MARLPTPGSDKGTWGNVLNDFLLESHAGDGSLKHDSVGSDQLQDNAVTNSTIAPGTITAAEIQDGTIQEDQLHTSLQTKINEVAPVTSVASRTGDVILTKDDVGLENVDNTSDEDKPVSLATQAALDEKATTVHAHDISDVTGLESALDDKADQSAIDAIIDTPLYTPNRFYTGPTATGNDAPTITTGIAADGTFNESYSLSGNALPNPWPVDMFGVATISNNTWSARTSNTGFGTVTTYRLMCDGSELVIFSYNLAFWADIFIDGRPYASNPLALGVSTGYSPYGFTKLVFGSAKPRLIELRTVGGIVAVYTKKPYRIWKPQPDTNPSVAVVGDSFVAPSVMNNSSSGAVTTGAYLRGIYQQMPAELGITKLVTDGLGGTGYIAGGGSSRPYTHADRISWLQSLNPNVIVVHGGGVNDLYTGNSVAATITAVTNYFTTLRSNHPAAKLVFVEGFASPLFTPGTYNPNFISIRQGVQSNLATAGIDAYFIDVATTRPPIAGTGYVTATTGAGNSDIYVGSDAAHLTVAGNAYVRSFLAPKLARVLADRGSLVNTLI